MSKSRQIDVFALFQDVMFLQGDKKELKEFQELILSLEDNLELKGLVEEYMFTLYKIDEVHQLKDVMTKQLDIQEETQSHPTHLKSLEEKILEIAHKTSKLLKVVKTIKENMDRLQSEGLGKGKYLGVKSNENLELTFTAMKFDKTNLKLQDSLSEGSALSASSYSEHNLERKLKKTLQTIASRKKIYLEKLVSIKESTLTEISNENIQTVSQDEAIKKHRYWKENKLENVMTKQLVTSGVKTSNSTHLKLLEETNLKASKLLELVYTSKENMCLQYEGLSKSEYSNVKKIEHMENVHSTSIVSGVHEHYLERKSKDSQELEVIRKLMHFKDTSNENDEMGLKTEANQTHRLLKDNEFDFDMKTISNGNSQPSSNTQHYHSKESACSLFKTFETEGSRHEEKPKPHICIFQNSSNSSYDYDTEDEDFEQNEIKLELLTKDKLQYFEIRHDKFNSKEIFIELFDGFKPSDKMQLFKTNKPLTEMLKGVKIRFGDDLGTVAENLANPVVVIQIYSSAFQSSQEIPGEIEGRLTITKRELQMNVVKASMFEDAISSTVTLGDLTYTLWFPSNCRLFEYIPVLRGSFIHRKDQQLNNLPPQNI